jgi:quinol monooxygenase YgiN
MSETKYESMSDQELKRYLIEHRDDQEAFYAYMDRRYARSYREAISPDDPDWETKI